MSTTFSRGLLLVLVSLFCPQVASNAQTNLSAQNEMVTMLRTIDASGSFDGALCGSALVLSASGGRTLLLTAKHVLDGLADENEARQASNSPPVRLAAQFFGSPGSFYEVRALPGIFSRPLDYAVLEIVPQSDRVVPRPHSWKILGTPYDPFQTDGDRPRLQDVRPIGNNKCEPWSTSQSVGKVISVAGTDIVFETRFVDPGNSGGGLFAADGGLIGMVVQTEGDKATARSLEILLSDLAAKHIAIDLAVKDYAPTEMHGTQAGAGGSRVDLAGANAILRDAVASRPTSDMGQVEAVQALARAGKGIGGMDFDGIMLDALSAEALAAQDLSFVLGTLKKAELPNATMTRADLTFADLSGGVFDGATMDTTEGSFITATDASFKNVKLRKGNWSAAILDRSKFSGADLADSSFSLASLRDVDFTSANLGHGVFVGADLRGSRFDGARAESIDVTGALFDDATFPSALRGKLCSSEPPVTQTIELRIFEHRKATDSDYENIARWIGPLGFPEHLDRHFKTCPSRDGRLAEQSLVYSSFGKGDRDAINSALRADVTTEVVGAANRRAGVKAKINELIARWSRQLEALGNSNSYYRSRRTAIIEAMDGSAKKMTRPAVLMLSFDTDALIKAKYGLAKPEARDLARNRLQLEQSDRIAYDSWPPLFPPETVWEDLDAPTVQAFAKWNDWRLQNLPTRLKIKFSAPSQQTGDPAFFPKTVDEVMAPYDAEETPEHKRRSDERAALCHELTEKLRFDSSKDAEREALERKLNYNGINFFGCWQVVLPVDRSRVLEPSWFHKDTTLMLYEGWLIALNGGFPPIPDPVNGKKLILSGTIERILLLPPVAKVEQRTPVIVLRDLTVGSQLPVRTARVRTAD